MSPLFGRKKKKPEPEVPENTWEIYEATYDDAPLIIRCNSQYIDFPDRKKFGYQAGVAIALNEPHQGGLPDEAENRELLELESKIETFLCQDGDTLFAMALTTGVMKELIFYTSDPDITRERFESLETRVENHRIQTIIEQDEQWETYFNFIP